MVIDRFDPRRSAVIVVAMQHDFSVDSTRAQ